ncbi:MAG: fructosamine kinase family protein [Luteibaculaceae bacterium]
MEGDKIKHELIELLSSKYKLKHQITDVVTVGGGSINNNYKIITNNGLFFLKTHNGPFNPDFYVKEAQGLQTIASTGAVKTPEVIQVNGEEDCLLLQYVQPGIKDDEFWLDLGRSLAELHKNEAEQFGFDNSNYIGNLVQPNAKKDNWCDFFITQRLSPMIEQANDKNLLSKSTIQKFDKLFTACANLFPSEKPALVHGDLWSGNFICSMFGEPYLIDPAVYYGHREVDLAMSKLFGGFNSMFYEGYEEVYKPMHGWENRVDLFNLYPLLVHLNLFGGSYALSIEATLKKYL